MFSIAELSALGMAIFVTGAISLKFVSGIFRKQNTTTIVEPPSEFVPLPSVGVASPQHRETTTEN